MPKYKVKYTFEVEVEAPNKNIAKINADYHLDNDLDEYYLWDYETHSEVIELEAPEDLKENIENGTQTLLTFKFDDEHSYLVEVENIEQLKPSEKYEKRMLDCLVNYTCRVCKDKNNCKHAFDEYCTFGDCLLEK